MMTRSAGIGFSYVGLLGVMGTARGFYRAHVKQRTMI